MKHWKLILFATVLFVVLMAGISQLEVYHTETGKVRAEIVAGQRDAVQQEALQIIEKSWGIRIR